MLQALVSWSLCNRVVVVVLAALLLVVGIYAAGHALLALRDGVQWTVRPLLLKPGGAAQVTILGGEVRQYQVLLKPAALAARQLGLTDVLEATRLASGIRGAGFLENDRQRINIRSE